MQNWLVQVPTAATAPPLGRACRPGLGIEGAYYHHHHAIIIILRAVGPTVTVQPNPEGRRAVLGSGYCIQQPYDDDEAGSRDHRHTATAD